MESISSGRALRPADGMEREPRSPSMEIHKYN